MTHAVAVTSATHAKLRAHLLRSDGQEDICFALWRPSQGTNRLTAVVQEQIVLPLPGERHIHGNASFEPHYFLRAAELAAGAGCGLALLHSHPRGKGWQALSHDDTAAEVGYAAQTLALTGLPLLGMTMAGSAHLGARLWKRAGALQYERFDCESVRIVGDQMEMTYNPELRPLPPPNPMQLRTVSAWGDRTQAELVNVRVGIIGLGSVGSIIAEALVRMGMTNLVLMDFDAVEEHNLDRLLNVTRRDIGRAKVSVVGPALRDHATAAKVSILELESSVVEPDGYRAALDCDVLFACVDRPWPRQVLNFLAYAHLIPVIDGGIAVDATGGTFHGAEWRAHVAAPGRRCMECLGQVEPGLVELERQGLLDDPRYIEGLPNDHPARRRENVFAFSTAAAGMQLTQFLQMFTAPLHRADIGAQTYHLTTGEIDRDTRSCRPTCAYSSALVFLKADDSNLVVTGRHALAEKQRADRTAPVALPQPTNHPTSRMRLIKLLRRFLARSG